MARELHKNQQKEFIEWLEKEKDRLARECSQIYENGFGRVRLVSEDVHDEISRILEKYKEIIGEDMEKDNSIEISVSFENYDEVIKKLENILRLLNEIEEKSQSIDLIQPGTEERFDENENHILNEKDLKQKVIEYLYKVDFDGLSEQGDKFVLELLHLVFQSNKKD